MKIPVCFVIDKPDESGGRVEVTAVFPSQDINPARGEAHRVCYAHIGQHGECSLNWISERTRPATAEEYAPLLAELTGIYNRGGDALDVQAVPGTWQ